MEKYEEQLFQEAYNSLDPETVDKVFYKIKNIELSEIKYCGRTSDDEGIRTDGAIRRNSESNEKDLVWALYKITFKVKVAFGLPLYVSTFAYAKLRKNTEDFKHNEMIYVRPPVSKLRLFDDSWFEKNSDLGVKQCTKVSVMGAIEAEDTNLNSGRFSEIVFRLLQGKSINNENCQNSNGEWLSDLFVKSMKQRIQVDDPWAKKARADWEEDSQRWDGFQYRSADEIEDENNAVKKGELTSKHSRKVRDMQAQEERDYWDKKRAMNEAIFEKIYRLR